MAVDNYPITTVRAQHFQGPESDSDYGFRTVPTLLRAVADWMDQNDLQDPEFDDLRLTLIWERPDRASLLDEDDPYHYSATVYYEEPEKPREGDANVKA